MARTLVPSEVAPVEALSAQLRTHGAIRSDRRKSGLEGLTLTPPLSRLAAAPLSGRAVRVSKTFVACHRAVLSRP
jgi:hypothetical protein